MKRFYYLAALMLTAFQLSAQTYCTPVYTYGCSDGDEIDSFSIPSAAFSDPNTGCSPGAYGDFYDTKTITLQAGVPYSYEITHAFGSQKVKIWVDFNNDGTFANDATETVSAAASVNETTNGTIIIPGSVVPGTYRMRVGDRYSSDPIPCNTDGWGETQDYKLVVTSPPSCVSPTAVTNTNVTSTSVDVAWTASSSNPANGYEIYYTTSNAPADASTVPSITGITGVAQTVSNLQPSTEYYIWVRSKCSSSSYSMWFYGGKITTLTFCPSVTAPANGANGQSLTPTISWTAVTGATSYTLTVGTSAGASDIMAGVNIGNVTSYTFPTPLTTSTQYYYTVNAQNATINSNSCTERSFMTMCNPYTVPYFEGFESGYAHNTDIAGCLAQEGVNSTTGTWKANNTFTDYNRTPRTGNWDAFLGYGNERWLFIPIQLTGGTAYQVKAYARQDGATAANSNVSISYGTSASAAAMTNVIAPATGIINGDYQKISGNFVAPTTGVYVVGIKGYMNFSPWYITLDDISIDVAPSCLEPATISVSGASNTSFTATWTAAPVAPAGGYDVYYSTSNTPPTATTTPNANTTALTYTVNGLAPDTVYYVWVRSHCSSSQQSAWTGYAMALTGYCTPTGGASSTTYYLSEISTTGGISNLTYSASSYNAYDNQSATVFSGAAGTTVNTALKASGGTNYFFIWVDWNNNLNFNDTGETVLATTQYTATATGDIVIPPGQAPGNYRVRMGLSYISAIIPCGPAPWGNYVDFTLQVTGTAGTSEIANTKDAIKVYPNPFQEVLNISDVKDVKTITITDISGRLLKTINKPTTELHLGELKTGLYLVTLNYKDGSSKTIKAVKK